jgi:hypothetical protein
LFLFVSFEELAAMPLPNPSLLRMNAYTPVLAPFGSDIFKSNFVVGIHIIGD